MNEINSFVTTIIRYIEYFQNINTSENNKPIFLFKCLHNMLIDMIKKYTEKHINQHLFKNDLLNLLYKIPKKFSQDFRDEFLCLFCVFYSIIIIKIFRSYSPFNFICY